MIYNYQDAGIIATNAKTRNREEITLVCVAVGKNLKNAVENDSMNERKRL